MSTRRGIIGGSLLGAVAIHLTMVACGSGASVANDGGVLDAIVDAARDVVGIETPDARAQDASGGCACPPGMPVGAVVAYAGPPTSVPDGWALCDGHAVPRTGDYAALHRVLSELHGVGDGINTFNLPDYRGRFLRGQDLGSMRDPDRMTRETPDPTRPAHTLSPDAIGSVQGDALRAHAHGLLRAGFAITPQSDGRDVVVPGGANAFDSVSAGGAETRPVNVSVNYLIKL